jgi:cell division inhibitor SepF
MSLMRRAMEYLGLGGEDLYDDYPQGRGRPGTRPPVGGRDRYGRGRRYEEDYLDDTDEEYDDDVYDEFDEGFDEPRSRPRPGAGRGPSRPGASRPAAQGVRPSRANDSGVHVQPLSRGAGRGPAAPTGEVVNVNPVQYDEAKEIGDLLKSGKAVKMDIGRADEDTARRLIDFASGLVYATEGSIDRVAAGVFMLRPRATRTVRIG